MPAAAIASKFLSLPELSLKTVYSVLMIGLSLYLLQQSGIAEESDEVNSLSMQNSGVDTL
jgi:hypothetical protein